MLAPAHRDALALLDETGWHVSELARFVRGVELAATAERLRARDGFSVGRFYDAIKAACVVAQVEPFTAGRMRHTLATRAVEAGADVAAVATYLGHKSPSTLRRFYATLAVPPRPKR